jgi:hypothetical protein
VVPHPPPRTDVPGHRIAPIRVLSFFSLAILLLAVAPMAASAKGGRHAVDVTAAIILSADAVTTGGSVTVDGVGFDGKAKGTVTLGEVRVAAFTTSPHGRFSVEVIVPGEVDGVTAVTATTAKASASATLTVSGAEDPVADGSDVATGTDVVHLGDANYPLSGTDLHRGTDDLVRFTPAHGSTTGTNEFGVEAQVVDDVIVAIEDRVGSMSIPVDGWVLSGHGNAAQFLRDHAGVGGTVRWASDEPVTDGPVADEPVADEPVTDEPVTGGLVVEQPRAPVSTEALTWAPPSGWEDYTEVVLPPTGGVVDLASDVDYRISAPQTRTAALHLRGGRNVVWIGGHVRIENQPHFSRATDRRAIVVSDATDGSSVPGRVIHLEGLLLDGDDLSEGINTNVPSAIVQLQNIRVEEVRLRGADDRDGTGGYPSKSHPDVVQLWGSKRQLRIDGLTGRSNYQGLFLNEATAARRLGPNYLRRVDVEMVSRPGEDGRTYAGHRGYVWTRAASGRQFLDNGTVWVAAHPDSGWTSSGPYRRSAYRDTTGTLVDEPVFGTSTFGDNLSPATRETAPYTLQIGQDALGTFGYWLDTATVDVAPDVPAVRDFSDRAPGRIYSGHPPEGDYVPLGSVGIGYVSPGYRS